MQQFCTCHARVADCEIKTISNSLISVFFVNNVKTVFNKDRITSYNVCYTKLLRRQAVIYSRTKWN